MKSKIAEAHQMVKDLAVEADMASGLPRKAKVGIPGKTVNIDPATYFLATRMERNGMLRPGAALMLAVTLPTKKASPKRGKK